MSCNCQKSIRNSVKELATDEVKARVESELSRFFALPDGTEHEAAEGAREARRALHPNPPSADRAAEERILDAAALLNDAGIYSYSAGDLIRIATYVKEN